MSHFPISQERAAWLMRRATYASVTVAALIILAKLMAWIVTDSLSMLSTLVDSMLDILVSLINMAAVHYALKPADDDHRFGHGKAEDIASFAQAAFIAGSALFITIEAITRLVSPHVVEHPRLGIIVMLYSIVLTVALLIFQRYVVLRTKSIVISADSLHYKTDLLVNIAVIMALLGSMHMHYIDTLIALIIAAYIFKSAWEIGREAFNKLMDKELDEPTRDRIKAIILEHKHAKGLHDLRTRYSGMQLFIQFHLELDGEMTLHEVHHVSDEIEARILADFPNAEVTIHEDPEGVEEVGLHKEPVKSII